MFQVLVCTCRHALLLGRRQRLGSEAGDALREAALDEAVEHAERVFELHLLQPLEHLCGDGVRNGERMAGTAVQRR